MRNLTCMSCVHKGFSHEILTAYDGGLFVTKGTMCGTAFLSPISLRLLENLTMDRMMIPGQPQGASWFLLNAKCTVYQLCDLRKVTSPLCASFFLTVK